MGDKQWLYEFNQQLDRIWSVYRQRYEQQYYGQK